MPLQLCTHVFDDHHTCGSPALRGQLLCFYHHPSRKPPARLKVRRGFTLPALTDRASFNRALFQVITRLASNKLDTQRAGLLLYSLQIAAKDLPT